ncbi:hypothetical protein HMPREF0653_02589 [Prevotella disiens JCM 6334 = ATCC 29426]|uniref:Uncharacterized protein n=1 Tax=Prevotella disiens JCM 6334 = ATCC 29426 TaxID=1235811 RepID=A0ABN0NNR5_9BACT|nr:hypothetical protein HMPREF0653_02589 [Prevotella disiens JCM 6334 = ATCC 29426]
MGRKVEYKGPKSHIKSPNPHRLRRVRVKNCYGVKEYRMILYSAD